MKYMTTVYRLSKDNRVLEFMSEKEACEFVGVRQSSVATAYFRKCKCKGYSVDRVGSTSHGMTKTRLFKIWNGMKDRCYLKSHPHYKDYGGRGIIVCDKWKSDFLTFKSWAYSNGYTDELTIDRIDVNGNYSPDNCRWVTRAEQLSNTRHNRFVVYDGVRYTFAQLARKYSIPKSTISWRARHNRDLVTGEYRIPFDDEESQQ